MKLYEFGPTRSMRVRWTLQELEIDFDAVTVDMLAGEHKSPAFLEINPAGKLPVLIDGDLVLTESVAIVLYLGEKYPGKGLVPTDLARRAELNHWLLFTATELEQPLWRISRQTNLYPVERRLAEDVPLARDDFMDMAAVLDRHMDGKQFALGEQVTVADFVLGHTLDWANEIHLLDGFPLLQAYIERMYARPRAPPRIADAFARIKR